MSRALIEQEKQERLSYRLRLSQKVNEIQNEYPEQVRVPGRLTNPEYVVIQARHYLEAQSTERWRGWPSNIRTRDGLLSVTVTKSNIARMMRFINTLIMLLAKRGHLVKIEDRETVVIIDGEKFHVQFREKCTRQLMKNSSWGATELVPNGKLSMKLDYPYSCMGREWIDGSPLIEDQLAKIVAYMELKAEQEKREREEREQRWADQRKLKELEEQRNAVEEARKQKALKLIDDASKWQAAKKIQLFIAEVESRGAGEVMTSEVHEWIEWAKNVQASLNPLSKDILEYM